MANGVLCFVAGVSAALLAVSALPDSTQQGQGKPQTIADFPDLGRGLMETPGCLGVTSFARGKQQVIAAWFENRKAMEAWYYGPMHSGAMAKFFPGMGKDRKPFAGFKDEKAPMLIIASVTPGEKAIAGSANLHVAQIAIEGYTPVPGGVAFGGTWSPEKLNVPGMVRVPGN